MKFLFVSASYKYGGAETYFITLTKALAAAGHSVEAVVFPDAPIARALSHSAVRLHAGRFRNALDLRGFRAIVAAARQRRPDWLVGATGKEHLATLLMGKKCGIPVALIRHRPGMKGLAARLVMSHAQRFFAVSDYARRDYIRCGMPRSRVRVLYNPIDTTLFCPDSAHRRAMLRSLGLGEHAIVLGYIGRMDPGKGVFTLLETANAAMTRERRLHCLWIGDGSCADELRERITHSTFATRHHQLGWMPDVYKYYHALSLLAMPSITPETFGRVSLEAQACSVPVLGSNHSGLPETLKPSVTGMLVPPGDVNALHDAILVLCDDKMRLSMATAARSFTQEKFNTSMVAAEFVRQLQQ